MGTAADGGKGSTQRAVRDQLVPLTPAPHPWHLMSCVVLFICLAKLCVWGEGGGGGGSIPSGWGGGYAAKIMRSLGHYRYALKGALWPPRQHSFCSHFDFLPLFGTPKIAAVLWQFCPHMGPKAPWVV